MIFSPELLIWGKLFIILIPIWLLGVSLFILATSCRSLEIILPAGLILGFSIFNLLLNTVQFWVKGQSGIILSFILSILLMFLFLILVFQKIDLKKLNLGKTISKELSKIILWTISTMVWGWFLIWKAGNALIGSDSYLYYSIASTFIKGNYPPKTPWQPDLNLAYHLGVSELLGALHFLTQANFEFLHVFLSFIFILSSSQIIIWILNKKANLILFLISNTIAALIFISFGFFNLIIPVFPFSNPHFISAHELLTWLRQLPRVNDAIEVYGAPIDLDEFIYFIFHAYGFALSLLIICITNFNSSKHFINWVVIFLLLSCLGLVNEAFFVIIFPSVLAILLTGEIINKNFKKSFRLFLILIFLTLLIVSIQGGVISNVVTDRSSPSKTFLIFPKNKSIATDFASYHLNQEISRDLGVKDNWLPFHWFHLGLEYLIPFCVILIFIIKVRFEEKKLLIMFFLAGFFSFIDYQIIVPKFIVADGNRFLAFSFLYFTLFLGLATLHTLNLFKNKLFLKIILLILFIWISVPTIIPPLAFLSKNRFTENKLSPHLIKDSLAMDWLSKNVPYSTRVIVLDLNSPHPSGQIRALVNAGVFAPVFSGEARAYTIEASPEYTDITYTLDPNSLNKLKASLLFIDSTAYFKLTPAAKQDLNNPIFFEQIFSQFYDKDRYEKIFRIRNDYLNKFKLTPGTFSELSKIVPKNGNFYIDDEENFSPSFLRRPLIYTLRGRKLFFHSQSGVYLNVESFITYQTPKGGDLYNYFLLGKDTNPWDICKCRASLIWEGVNNQIFFWRNEDLVIKQDLDYKKSNI